MEGPELKPNLESSQGLFGMDNSQPPRTTWRGFSFRIVQLSNPETSEKCRILTSGYYSICLPRSDKKKSSPQSIKELEIVLMRDQAGVGRHSFPHLPLQSPIINPTAAAFKNQPPNPHQSSATKRHPHPIQKRSHPPYNPLNPGNAKLPVELF
ncbi:hypothetical protein JTE90_023063 [Oedothorax gibbosus]|uniref:Uncharacterized protein n=1 Tax=Oedothorax gibbosus TaxID=931172 RepID=A0AAV6UY04_9ARAC|nr:hypothetical protein JTE90_023063 [Oedothorax gibbosus]